MRSLPVRRPPTTKVWIAGSGRSGTTWLGQLVDAVARTSSVFEPLHPDRVRLSRATVELMHSNTRPYLSPDETSRTWSKLIDHIYRGRYDNDWTRQGFEGIAAHWTLGDHLRDAMADKRVVKAIRSNLLIGWLARTTDVKVVYLIRHPCSTILSQKTAGWAMDPRGLLASRRLVQDHLVGFDWLGEGEFASEAERRAVFWSIENLVPLRQAGSEGFHLVTYEDLVRDPLREARKLFVYLGWQLDDDGWRRVEQAAGPPASSRLGRWTEQMDRAEIEAILSVVARFGIDLYDHDVMPQGR
jgi:hypothetical protein